MNEFLVLGYSTIKNKECMLTYNEFRDRFIGFYINNKTDRFEPFIKIKIEDTKFHNDINHLIQGYSKIGILERLQAIEKLDNCCKSMFSFTQKHNKDKLILIEIDCVNSIEKQKGYTIKFRSKLNQYRCRLNCAKILNYIGSSDFDNSSKKIVELVDFINRDDCKRYAILYKRNPKDTELIYFHCLLN